MIRNVIFDLGNVLINYDFELFFERLGYKRGERSLEEAHELIYPFECGRMKEEEFLAGLAEVYSSKLDADEFREAWCDVFWQNDELMEVLKQLAGRFRLMILSNNDELHFPYIWEKYPALHVFEQRDIMITSRLGYVKPQPEVYKTAAELHKFRWDESLFIDDKEENLIVPEELGAWAICHQENIVTNDELKMLCSDLD